jgi:F-type H+-transporting ATPase subunit epsilon
MPATFQLEVVTPEKLMYSGEVQAVRAPGVDGSFGVLAGHAPMLAELTVGLLKLTLPNGFDAYAAIDGGFLQVSREKVIILANSAELSEEIDVERAKAAAARARQLLEVPGSGLDAEAVRQELERATNRIRIAQMRS